MATTGYWPVKSRLKDVIEYARNPEKTTDDLLNALSYAAYTGKTEKAMYVSAINCPKQRAYECMIATKNKYRKMGGNVAYHGYQSFKTGEVTAEQAHRIGMETAKKMWGKDYEIVVTTHLNTDNLHNHFIVNSVSFRTGKKFENHISDHFKLRDISDRICKEYGLSVIENPKGKGVNYSEREAKSKGLPTIRDTIRNDIDRVIAASFTQRQFIQNIEAMGYELKTIGENGRMLKYPALKPPGAKGYFRFHKLGKGYDLEQIVYRIHSNMQFRDPYPDMRKPIKKEYGRIKGVYKPYPKAKGLRALYLRYCYELGIIRKHTTSVRKISVSMREDIIKMDKYFEQSKFLGRNRINTFDELKQYRQKTENNISVLTEKRKDLRNELRREERKNNNTEKVAEIKTEISDISEKLKYLRKDLATISQIENKSQQIKENIQDISTQKSTERNRQKEREVYRWR